MFDSFFDDPGAITTFSDKIKKILVFMISLALHTGFFLTGVFLVTPFKIDTTEITVRYVKILPMEGLFLPSPEFKRARKGAAVLASQEKEVSEAQEETPMDVETIAELLATDLPDSETDIENNLSFPPLLSRDFKLDISSSDKKNESSNGSLKLILGTENPENLKDMVKGDSDSKPPDFNKYLLPDYLRNRGFSYSKSAGRSQNGSNSQQVGAFLKSPGFDITPWAAEVLEKIQNHWDIPLEPESPVKGQVRIALNISKTGEMINIEVIESSFIPVYDQSALDAIRSSMPFSGLPIDFPWENLRMDFIFQYNE